MASILGCLLDVSGSMKAALEPELERDSRDGDEAVDRFQAILAAALRLARAQQQTEPDAQMFVGVFGLDANKGYPPVIDVCSAIEAVFGSGDAQRQTGHQQLIRIAYQNDRQHIET